MTEPSPRAEGANSIQAGLLDYALLKQLINYCPATGRFTRHNGARIPVRKRRQICLNGKLYQASKIAWFYIYGYWPTYRLFFVNGDNTDYRLTNLRPQIASVVEGGTMAYSRAWRAARPEKYMDLELRQYGITSETYTQQLYNQGGVCAICRHVDAKSGQNGQPQRLAVDHCHKTGKIRGLLCSACNLMLGNAQDDPRLLRLAASYLEQAA